MLRASVLITALMMFVLTWACAFASSAYELVERGNRLYNAGKLDEALEAYEKASVENPESARIYFNKGAVYYKKDDFAKAREAYEKAALATRDLKLEAKCKFNLGNCSFRQAERQKDSDIKKSLAMYEQSIRYYQEALKLDEQLKDAAHNIEVARLVMKDLLDKLKKMQQQQKEQQQKQKEIAEKLKELARRQDEALKKNKELTEKMQQKGPSEGLKQDIRALAEEQKDIQDETKKLSEKMSNLSQGQKGQPTPMDKAKEHLDKAGLEEGIAREKLEKEKLKGAQPNQSEALKELKKAMESLAGPSGGGQGKEGENEQSEKQAQQQKKEGGENRHAQQQERPAGSAPRDERARDILNEEKENRDRRQRQVPLGQIPVDKDW